MTIIAKHYGRLRSKPMWTLRAPKNRPWVYAVDILRLTLRTRS
jgi:hypothetical protein